MRFPTALTLALALGSGTSAYGSILAYGDGGSAGNHTGAANPLNIGREFSVTGTGITIVDLGVYAEDNLGAPITLSASHDVTLFSINPPNSANPSATFIATGNVPQGSGAPYDSGFRFAPVVGGPIFLAPGNYAVIAYGLDNGNEGYGDGGSRLSSANANDLVFDPYQFTSAGSPNFPNTGDGNDHNGASFHFDLGNTTPEPGSLALFGLSAAGALIARRR